MIYSLPVCVGYAFDWLVLRPKVGKPRQVFLQQADALLAYETRVCLMALLPMLFQLFL
jgi:hypothetical protein